MTLRPLLLLAAALAAFGGGSTTWESSTYGDFLKGRLTGLSLTREGRLQLAPQLNAVLATDQAAVWAIAAAPDGTLYAGTGHRGGVYRIDRQGRTEKIWTAPAPEVFALALDQNGRLYAATSPNGKVYRLDGSGKAEEVFDPKERYLWSLAPASDGALYAGAGDSGRIWRIEPDGKGRVYYETGQTHVVSLVLDRQGRLLAGTEPNGILYRIESSGKGFVLYDSSLPEIRAVTLAPDGSIYAAALGGGLAQKTAQSATTAASAAGSTPSVTTSITVTSDAQAGIDLRPKPETPKPPATEGGGATTAGIYDLAGLEKSAIYRIAPDNTVETLFSSKEENIYDLALSGGGIAFATDLRGRIYHLASDRKATLLAETLEGETTRLMGHPGGLLAATGNLGKIYRLDAPRTLKGWYESPVHDAGNVARWGRLEWRGDKPAGSAIRLRTRSGNSMRPDKTWSDWSDPLTTSAPVASPNARFLQWRLEMEGPAEGPGPGIDSVLVSYLPQNNRPSIRSITVTPLWAPSAGAKTTATAAAVASGAPSYSITVTDTGEAPPATSSGTPTQALQRQGNQQMLISWQADDPDADRLLYSLWFRGTEEREWKKIKDQLSENTYTLEADLLADGRYLFRVEASDHPSNTAATARTAELVSPPVFVDNTPPLVTATRSGPELVVQVSDAASPLRRVEYSLDAGPWLPLEAEDGITDSREERYRLRLPSLAAGEHVVVIRAYDTALNPGLAKVILP